MSFCHGEMEVATATGIHVKKLQQTRIKHLKQGEHWDLCEQQVAYAPAGLAAVLEKITGQAIEPHVLALLTEKTVLSCLQKNGAEPLKATISRFFPNPHLVQIELPDGTLASLRVKTAAKFKRGMLVPVRLNDQTHVYELTRREPRFPGRW